MDSEQIVNSELSKVGRYEFLTEPFHCDFSQHLMMGHLGNVMLNAADFHSHDRGYGVARLQSIKKTWVLSRLAIDIVEMPKAYDKLAIETWVENVMRYFTNRNFVVTAPDNSKAYAYGRSVWAMIDTDTRQPVDILSVNDGEIANWVDKDKPCPMDKPGRVKISSDAEYVRTVVPQYSDIDINGHVNSIKYIEHVLDLFPKDWYHEHHIRRFEIAYVAESHFGDELRFYREQTADDEYCIRITKNYPNEVEVVRSLVKFV